MEDEFPIGAEPFGAVAFLFTEIEGSTKLLHAPGDDYAVALRDDPRLRQANGGGRNAPGPESARSALDAPRWGAAPTLSDSAANLEV